MRSTGAGGAQRNGKGQVAQPGIQRDGSGVGCGERNARETLPDAAAQPSQFHGVRFDGRHDGDGVQMVEFVRHFIAQAKHLGDALAALVHERGALEIHVGAHALAGAFRDGDQRLSSGAQESGDAFGLAGVFFDTDRLLAGPQTAPHLAVNAAGMRGAGFEIFLTAPQLEKVEKCGFKTRRRSAIAKRTEINGGSAADVRRYQRARELV